MELRRFVRLIFLFFLTFFMLWNHAAYAEDPAAQTGGGNEQVACEFDDAQKKQLAERGYSETDAARKKLEEVAQLIKSNFKDSGGPCHYLDDSIFYEDGEWSAHELNYTDEDKKGAEEADKILGKSGNNSTTYNVDRVNSGDLKDYTDWNFSKLRQRAYSGSGKLAQVANWVKTAKPGQTIPVDDDVRDLVCERVKCTKDTFRNDCDAFMLMDHSGTIACMDRGMGSRDISVNPNPGEENAILGKVVVTDHREGDSTLLGLNVHYSYDMCAYSKNGVIMGTKFECGAVNYDPRDVAYKWDNLDALMRDVADDKTKQCEQALSKAETAMGNADEPNSFLGHRKKAHEALVLLSGELECSCEKDANGEIHGTCKDDDFEQNQDMKKCKSVAAYQEELSGFCITCKLFASIIGTAQKISANAFTASADSLCGLLGIALLIYIAYMTLVTIASPETQKLSKYLGSITVQGLKVAITILILQNPTFLYQKLLSPILDGSIDFSIALTGEKGEVIAEKGAKYSDSFDQNSEYLSAKTAQNMVGAIDNFTDSAALMPAIGRALICRSWTDLGLSRAWMVPRIMMFIEGSIIYIFGLGILLAIGFYMLDCAVELCLVFALMTFFVACWPFKMTSGYTKIGWNMFLNAFFNFIMMSVIIITIVRLSSQALSVGNSIEELQALVNSDLIEDLENAMDLGGLQMVMVVVCCMMCFKLPKESGRLANKFAGGAHISMGGDLGGLAAGLVTNAVGRSARVAANVAAPGLKIATNLAIDNSGVKDKLKGLTSKAQNTIGRLGVGSKAKMGAKGRDANANKLPGGSTGGFLPDK